MLLGLIMLPISSPAITSSKVILFILVRSFALLIPFSYRDSRYVFLVYAGKVTYRIYNTDPLLIKKLLVGSVPVYYYSLRQHFRQTLALFEVLLYYLACRRLSV